LVVGLGNPGPDYRDTRHNAGFWLVDQWAGTLGLSFRKAWFRPFLWARVRVGADTLCLVKPTTYMNHSGRAIASILRWARATPADLLVVFDQMDLPPGRVRLKPHGSAAGHNGLKSLDAHLRGAYHRLAVGIGRPAPGRGVIDHVLGVSSTEDRAAIDAALVKTLRAAENWNRGWEPLLNAVNSNGNAS
jgi:PTH1 family peptidyl-tRNA hydrolase